MLFLSSYLMFLPLILWFWKVIAELRVSIVYPVLPPFLSFCDDWASSLPFRLIWIWNPCTFTWEEDCCEAMAGKCLLGEAWRLDCDYYWKFSISMWLCNLFPKGVPANLLGNLVETSWDLAKPCSFASWSVDYFVIRSVMKSPPAGVSGDTLVLTTPRWKAGACGLLPSPRSRVTSSFRLIYSAVSFSSFALPNGESSLPSWPRSTAF